MNRQLGHGDGGAAWKRVHDIISQMYHGCTRWLSWHRGDKLLVGAHLRPSSILRHHSNTPVDPPSSPCPVAMLVNFVLPVWLLFLRNALLWSTTGNTTSTAALELDLHVICDFFPYFFWKTRFRDMGRKKNCKYCGVLVTVRSVTLQLCRWSETPTSLMVNNSNNDVKDNYTNDASSSSWEIKKKQQLKLKNGFWKPAPERSL